MKAELVNPRRVATLLAAILALGLVGQLPRAARADAGGPPADLRVGHTVRHIQVTGTAAPGEPEAKREVVVHLWYPADQQGLADRPKTVYRSTLSDPALNLPLQLTPSWKVEAQIAREDAPIDPNGQPFPVIVFSHGSNNDPIDYAHTLELIAGAGFVVAAPYHVNNTQDDVRIDDINQQAGKRVLPCNDGLPPRDLIVANPPKPDCAKTSVPFNMSDRVRDIGSILDALPGWFGDRVDVSRAGVMGHSRGTVTALAAAGGSVPWTNSPNCVNPKPAGEHPDCWPLEPEKRVKAVMGMAIGAPAITNLVDLHGVDEQHGVRVPTVLLAGGRDQNSPQAVSEDAFAKISSADKLLVEIPNATHRSFDSTYCAQLQSAAAHVKSDPDAILDRHTVGLIAASPPMFLSGKAVYYCAPRFFTSPVNIQHVVASTDNAEYACNDTEDQALNDQLDPNCSLTPPTHPPESKCATTTSIPCTGLETDEVKQGVTEIAVAFFSSALKRTGNDGIHFTGYLAPNWLMEHVPMVGSATAYAGPHSVCPPDQGVTCSH
jgi:predicted dienelactone hydrolase